MKRIILEAYNRNLQKFEVFLKIQLFYLEDKATMESNPESVYLEDLNRAKNSSEQLNENNNEGKEDYADIENAHEIGMIFIIF